MKSTSDGQILLAGAGKMGTALLSGWLERGVESSAIVVQEPKLSSEADGLLRRHGVAVEASITKLAAPPSVIVVAVKPQVVDQVFPPLARLAGPDTVVLSIAAGKPIRSFAQHLAEGAAIVRAMPNTPAAIGRGITGAVSSPNLSEAQKARCEALLGAVGDVVWLDDEGLIDAVTAVSGSGPAYVFLLVEALAEAGEAAGLDEATAMRLARATVSGAGELLHQSQQSPEALRTSVTSPGGTTAAALEVLMREGTGLRELMTEAVLAAKTRGRELGS